MMPSFASWDGTVPWPHFENAAALWLLLLLFVPVVLWWLAQRRRRQVVRVWLGAQVGLAGSVRRWPGRILLLFILFGFIAALAGPEWGTIPIMPTHEARDALLLVDVSQSMLAEDRPPTSRLFRAKRDIEQFLEYLQQRRAQTRIGIGIFAGNARIFCPPTEDLEHVRKVVREMGPESFGPLGRLPESPHLPPLGKGGIEGGYGTSFRSAVSLAVDWLKKNPEDEPFVDCLLISDGDDVGDDVSVAATMAEEAKLTLSVLGIGDSQRDWPIPVKNGYLMAANPQTGVQERVFTRRHEEKLRQLAVQTGGKLTLEEAEPEPIVSWWNETVAAKPPRPLESITRQAPVNRAGWLLGIILLLLVLEVSWGGARRRDWW